MNHVNWFLDGKDDVRSSFYLQDVATDRVLLTRARQGMVIVIPEGNEEDHTRKKEYYDGTYNYLKGIGLQTI